MTSIPEGWSYGPWHDGPDPLAAPADLRDALDEIGRDVMSGSSPRSALEELLRRGTRNTAGPGRPAPPVVGPPPRDPAAAQPRRHTPGRPAPAERGPGGRAPRTVPEPVGRRPVPGSPTRPPPVRYGGCGPGAGQLRLAVVRGSAEVRGDPRAARSRAARVPVRGHEGGAAADHA